MTSTVERDADTVTVAAAKWTVTGTLPGAIGLPYSDATWVSTAEPFTVRDDFVATGFVVANANRVLQIRLRMRATVTSGTTDLAVLLRDPGKATPDLYSGTTRIVAPGVRDLTFAWHPTRPGGGEWTEATIDAAEVRVGVSNTFPGATVMIHALWLEIVLALPPVTDDETPATFTASVPVFSWYYRDADGDPQQAYELVLATAAAAVGITDPANLPSRIWETGRVFSSLTSHTGPSLLPGDYVIFQRSFRPWPHGDFGSGWDASPLTVSYTFPPTPTVTAWSDDFEARIGLSATVATATPPATVVEAEWSDDAVTWQSLRTSPATIVAGEVAFYDYEAPPGSPRYYRLRSTLVEAGTGALLISPWASVTATQQVESWWLKDPLDPSRNLPVKRLGPVRSGSRPRQTSVMDVYGAAPVATSGPGGWRRDSDEFLALTEEAADTIVAMLDPPTTLLLVSTTRQWYIYPVDGITHWQHSAGVWRIGVDSVEQARP